jgi:hypothetical protein
MDRRVRGFDTHPVREAATWWAYNSIKDTPWAPPRSAMPATTAATTITAPSLTSPPLDASALDLLDN